jgi:hypothetical protein
MHHGSTGRDAVFARCFIPWLHLKKMYVTLFWCAYPLGATP